MNFVKNKLISAILTLSLICSSAAVLSFSASAAPGDMNGDGKITASDARSILRIAASLDVATDEQRAMADVNGDGKVTASDARTVLRWAANLDPIPETPSKDESTTKTPDETTTETQPVEPTAPTDPTTEPTEPTQPAEPTTPPEDDGKYPSSIDAFFSGAFYMETEITEGDTAMPIKFATRGNVIAMSMPVGNIEMSILIQNTKTFLKLTDTDGKKYYCDFTELMGLVGMDFDEMFSGFSFGKVSNYGTPVHTKTVVDGTECDVYTFTIDGSNIVFYAVDGEVTGIDPINTATGVSSYMPVSKLSGSIPTDMLNTRGYKETEASKIMKILAGNMA